MVHENAAVVRKLLHSEEPAVRCKTKVLLLGVREGSREIREAREEVKRSPLVKMLLSERERTGTLPYHPYKKWLGAHWVLACLADIGYPPGDASLIPLREQVYGWLLSRGHMRQIRTLEGRVRRCASQEGNALFALLALGLGDERSDELADRLMAWQWPDGGWNCDKRPEAVHSSFMETLIPLRGLALHARRTGSGRSARAAGQAAEVFLKREMYKSRKKGKVIDQDFLALHYPCYWHYDILFGLKVMAESGFIGDSRCLSALSVLHSKRLPDGGFPAEKKYYFLSEKARTGRSLVDWGGTGYAVMNPFVTVDALYVLQSAGGEA